MWSHSDEALPETPGQRDRFQLWVAGQAHNVHGLRLTEDSLSAVPIWKSPSCDSCRVRFARAQVDSVKVEGVSGEAILIGSVALVSAMIFTIVEGMKSNYP